MESNVVVIISFAIYSLFIIGTGIYTTKLRKKTDADFVLANRELGSWSASLSASASSESGWVMLGLVGMAFSTGLSTAWVIPGIGAGYLFNWFVIAERLRKATSQMGALTLPQYISARFDPNSKMLRLIAVVIITTAMLGYVAAQMNSAGKAFEVTFSLRYEWGVLVGALIVLAYTITGGFRAICWTDIIQASFMVVALVGMPFVVLSNLESFGGAMDTLRAADPSLLTFTGSNVGFAMFGFVIGLIGIGFGYPGQPQILARFMAARDKDTVTKAGIISFIWFLLVYVGAIAFGLFARAYFGDIADPEQALPLACNEFLPPVLAGFVIAAIVSAICSTADSQLIVVSSTISRDVIPFFHKKPATSDNSPEAFRKMQLLDSGMLIVLALISVAFALTENRVIFNFVLYAWSALGAAFGPVVILGLMWKGTNKNGAIAGMLTGAIVTVVWKNVTVLKNVVYELVPAFILAFLAVWLVSLLTRPRVTRV